MHSFFYLADYFLKENFLFFLCFKEQNNTTYTWSQGSKEKTLKNKIKTKTG